MMKTGFSCPSIREVEAGAAQQDLAWKKPETNQSKQDKMMELIKAVLSWNRSV